jgi:AcrR family transcriptional regulator
MEQILPRKRRQQKTRRLILDTARSIVSEKGAEALSMRLLAERIEYSPSGIYEYFDSKEEILLMLNQEGHLQLREALDRVDKNLSPIDNLCEIGLAYIHFGLENPELYQVMFSNTPQISSYADIDVPETSFPILLQAIQRGLASGEFQARQGFGLYEMAYAAWTLVHGMVMLRIYQANFPPEFERVAQQTVRAFSRSLLC